MLAVIKRFSPLRLVKPRRMDAATIWHEAQNKPSLIVHDLAPYAPAHAVYESLLRRGVFKWLAVRRVLIHTKNVWRDRITESIERQRDFKDMAHAMRGLPHRDARRQRAMLLRWAAEERGYRRGLEQCRAEVLAMCHSDRWQAPDSDRAAQRWLDLRSEVA